MQTSATDCKYAKKTLAATGLGCPDGHRMVKKCTMPEDMLVEVGSASRVLFGEHGRLRLFFCDAECGIKRGVPWFWVTMSSARSAVMAAFT